jgi:hypothetical protein
LEISVAGQAIGRDWQFAAFINETGSHAIAEQFPGRTVLQRVFG